MLYAVYLILCIYLRLRLRLCLRLRPHDVEHAARYSYLLANMIFLCTSATKTTQGAEANEAPTAEAEKQSPYDVFHVCTGVPCLQQKEGDASAKYPCTTC